MRNVSSQVGRAPLHVAAQTGNLESLIRLLDAGAGRAPRDRVSHLEPNDTRTMLASALTLLAVGFQCSAFSVSQSASCTSVTCRMHGQQTFSVCAPQHTVQRFLHAETAHLKLITSTVVVMYGFLVCVVTLWYVRGLGSVTSASSFIFCCHVLLFYFQAVIMAPVALPG